MIIPSFLQAVKAFQQSDYASAATHAETAAAAEPSDSFYHHAATYLQQVAARGTHDIYASPEGFTAFVRGGGNVPLYANLSRQLQAIYVQHAKVTLLDIGVGDGLALLPALTDTLAQIDLVEPSATMLASTAEALTARAVTHTAFNEPIETFIKTQTKKYDIAQATFALHNLAPQTRSGLFSWLRVHNGTFLLAEFDVRMDAVLGSAEHISYLAERYRTGLAEYEPDETLVAQGFLMPILFRNFETIGEAAIYEQPIRQWEAELEAAGFHITARHLLERYWWADAYLLHAV